MTLYTQRSSNIRKTWILILVSCLLMIGVGWGLAYWYQEVSILYIAVIWSVGMSMVAYWRSDTIALSSYRAYEADKETHQELYRIVENLSITAGIPMPRVYILPTTSPNAFATGRNPKHASVAVTEGLLRMLDKSELEGVIAHELSHIKNYDTLIMTVVVVMVGILSIIANIFLRSMLFGGGRRDSRSNDSGSIGLILALIGIVIAPIAGTLLQFAISRKREFLADASGVLLTRYPEGLARALQKISIAPPFPKSKQATAHLFITNPMHLDAATSSKTNFFTKLFMTHPPIEERIKVLLGEKR